MTAPVPADQEEALREDEAEFRQPAPPPIPVRDRYYITECEHCGWVGSSEQCGGYDDDIVCPVCCSSICGDEPDEADIAKHGEAVMQRILAAEAERDQLAADLRKTREERDAHFMSLAAATCELMRGAHSGGAEIQALRKVCLLQARELKRLDPDGDTPVDLNAAMEKLRAALTPDPKDAGGTAKGDDHA